MSDHFGLIELTLTGAIALALGFWQLWSINREIRKDRDGKSDPPSGSE